jgi:3-oxoacyl-[acyl-carrier protein] reductase
MQTYLIVGASSGIGYQIAHHLIQQGHRIVSLSRTAPAIESAQITHYFLDVSNKEPVFPELEGPINGIIYCPGTINLKPFRALKADDYLTDFYINALGAASTIKKYLPNLSAAENANIVLFSTVAMQTGMAYHASIAMAKGAIEGLTRSLAAELAPKIRVNAIAPSLTATPLADKLINAEAKLKGAEERHPLKRIGKTDDIAQAAMYLLNATWVTGQILHVDGGLSSLK